jgi:hypothetical protein
MKPFLSVFLVIAALQTSVAQTFSLEAQVLSAIDSSAVPFATIFNKSSGEGVRTDLQGTFSLKTAPDDSIRVSAIGFATAILIASKSEETQLIYLPASIHQIDTIVIRAMPPKELFKQEFMALELQEENKIDLNIKEGVTLEIPIDPSDIRVSAPNELQSPGSIRLPIFRTMGAAMKLEKEKQELRKEKEEFAEIDRKYSNDFISKLTGLQDDEKIVALKKFCNFSKDFILENSEYDIAVAIVDCYKKFEEEEN